MKTIIAGSRSITSFAVVANAISKSGFANEITEVVCGMAKGVDLLGKQWADVWGVPVKEMPVTDEEYRILGRYQAPKARNTRMADYADALILVWDGVSGGSADMHEKAKARGLKIYRHVVKAAVQP